MAAFVKKSSRTPPQVIATAKKRLAQVRQQMEDMP